MKYAKILILILIIILMAFFIVPSLSAQAQNPDQKITKIRSGIVNIKANVARSAYEGIRTHWGTGFIVDMKEGFILTNRHISSPASVAYFEISFSNGQQQEAFLIYADPWHDFSILKVNPKSIPSECVSLSLSKEDPSLDQKVFVLGQSPDQVFSFFEGRIIGLYENVGFFPNQSLGISLVASGGSSGSPVLNTKHEVIGLLHSLSHNRSSSWALPCLPLRKALLSLRRSQIIPRKHIGILVSYAPMEDAIQFHNFPQKTALLYYKKYPQARGKYLTVSEIFQDGPAEGILQPGDMIWSLNKKEVGPDFFAFEDLLNRSRENVIVGFYRDGKYLEKKLKLYNLYDSELNEIVILGGAIFYEADDWIRRACGVPRGSVMITNILPGEAFSESFPSIPGTDQICIQVQKINGMDVDSLNSLRGKIALLNHTKNLVLEYRNLAFYEDYDSVPIFSLRKKLAYVQNFYGLNPEVWVKDSSNHQWIKEDFPVLKFELIQPNL